VISELEIYEIDSNVDRLWLRMKSASSTMLLEVSCVQMVWSCALTHYWLHKFPQQNTIME